MDERRRSKRRTLLYYLRVFDRRTGQEFGHVVDITTEGVLIMSESAVPIGAVCHLAVRLPALDGVDRDVEFEAECVRSGRDPSHAYIDTAFRIRRIDPAHRGRIETLIDDYGFRD